MNKAQRLAALDMTIRPDVLNNDGILLMAANSDAAEWTFHSVSENKYYVTTTVDGATKYLTIDGANVTLEDEPDEVNSLVVMTPGTGSNSGKWHLTVNGYSLNLFDSGSNGFGAVTGDGATTWMNLVEKSVLNDDDFNLYTAKKVSVSDEVNVYDGQQVVIYTRVWNDKAKKYEFYVVDHDGTLVRCYDNGDEIEWIGSQVNTALWQFTEYRNADGTLNYYYELQNTQYGNYIAPREAGGEVFSDSTIGVNLNGRRYGENYATIIAWDDYNYAYGGLKVEDGRVVACPLSEAEDFYFAVVNPIDLDDQLTTVNTVDNSEFGITMRMVDFNNPIQNQSGGEATNLTGRDSGQTAVLGYNTNAYGLVSGNLQDDGYPVTVSSVTGKASASLETLFGGATSVNHLFIQSVYNESGYFEYDSTQNFAHLNDDGTFTVYDQIGAVSDYTGITGRHGQFLPYDDLTPGRYCPSSSNTTSVLAEELPDLDPRKDEKLYNVGTQSTVDYFFGMEMEASFTQTPSGLDAWGHDIIFEFSGDDDFWLYVDGELILDVGGVHSASIGTINFRTGEVKTIIRNTSGATIRSQNTTLRALFKAHYEANHPEATPEAVEAYLNGIFKDSGTVFQDYTNHDMKMLYMERGAGASNLHMRFNLAAVKPGTFILSKKLSGTEVADSDLIEFLYQIYYKTKRDGDNSGYHLLDDSDNRVVYVGTTTPARYESAFTPAGEDTANLAGETPRKDFATDRDTLESRPKVDYDNQVSEGAMRALEITKKLYDADGQTLLTYEENQTEFTFRLYLGDENADAANLPLANMYDYCVKDAAGAYCRWDAASQRFVSLGVTDYASLTDDQKRAATFQTSMNGSISKIPADHTVEVRNLIIGTQYMVEERDWEIPRGYTRRADDGYTRVDGGRDLPQGTPYSDTIRVNEDPEIEVRNQRGWGLTVEKVWTDRDFMASHDDIYFAVYLRTADGGLALYHASDGTPSVRRLATTDTENYYFFEDLIFEDEAYQFGDFVIREVTISNESPTVTNGVVMDPGAVTPIEEGGTLRVYGVPVGGERQLDSYTVSYDVGVPTGHNENVRVDTITNSRPGIQLYKMKWNGEDPLQGAVFTLVDENGGNVAAASYTSAANGLITIAYLNPGTYRLTEIATPAGYVALSEPMTIIVDSDGDIEVVDAAGALDGYYEVAPHADGGMAATLTIKNRPTELRVLKVDAATGAPMAGVSFALYRQVIDNNGVPRKDYTPMSGCENLATDADGVLPGVTLALGAGTYYLTETHTIDGYSLLKDDLCFTIGKDGKVTINSEDASVRAWLTGRFTEEDGKASYVLAIPNGRKLTLKKVDERGEPLAGAKFKLNGLNKFNAWVQVDGYEAIDMTDTAEVALLNIGDGLYQLMETTPPAGYLVATKYVYFRVGGDGVTLTDENGQPAEYVNARVTSSDSDISIVVVNTPGAALPSTGSVGPTPCYLIGGGLTMLAGLLLWLRRRRRFA